MSLLSKLKKNSKLADTEILDESTLITQRIKDFAETKVPIINLALSGRLDGGLFSGLTTIAGPSRHFKSGISLVMCAAYLDKYPDAAMIFYDSEFGSPLQYFREFGVDTSRVLHVPIKTVEDLKFDLIGQLEKIEKGERVVIFVDSVGNLASKKELEDAINEKSVADMSRAKALKGLFRMVTPYLAIKNIPMLCVNHTYETMEMFSKSIISGGCVVAGTKVKTSTGYKTIESIQPGEQVLTTFGFKNVTHVWNPDTLENGNPECREVKFSDGSVQTVSESHSFLTADNQWIAANQVFLRTKLQKINGEPIDIVACKPVGKRPVYDLSVEHAEHYVTENGTINHNTGVLYSSDNAWIIGRRQSKEGAELMGYEFIINVEKSRFVREKSKIPLTVSFAGGINRYSGLFDLAKEYNYIVQSGAWYQIYDFETSQIADNKVRAASIGEEFYEKLLKDEKFIKSVKEKYSLGIK